MEEQTTVILNKEFAAKYDGRCFLDLDMPDRIEALKFTKTPFGLSTECIGCNYSWGYIQDYVDEYGETTYNDMYCGGNIEMIENGMYLHKEITSEKYEQIRNCVLERIALYEQLRNEFLELKSEILDE